MTTIWQSIGQLVSGTASPAYKKLPYDEERVEEWETTSRWRKLQKQHLRLPRIRRVAIILLLVDLAIFGLLLRGFQPLITLLRRNEEFFGPRVHLDAHDKVDLIHSQPSQHKIPRILHQTTANDTIPAKWVESQQSCRDVYSKYEYKVSRRPKSPQAATTNLPNAN